MAVNKGKSKESNAEATLFRRLAKMVHQKKAKDVIKDWMNDDAKKYASKLISRYGEPQVVHLDKLMWTEGQIRPFKKVCIKDESIRHTFPKEHYDYVYSTITFKVSEKTQMICANVSSSILIDRLKSEVTARCGDLEANSITLQLVQDIEHGKLDPGEAKQEYARRIKEMELPEWWNSE